jgi:hypothetical protein
VGIAQVLFYRIKIDCVFQSFLMIAALKKEALGSPFASF